MKDVADVLATLNELGRPDLAETIHFLMGERDGLMKALAAKAATVDSERECNEKLTAEVDALSARVAELERNFECEESVPGSISVCEVCGGHGCREFDAGFVVLSAKAKGE